MLNKVSGRNKPNKRSSLLKGMLFLSLLTILLMAYDPLGPVESSSEEVPVRIPPGSSTLQIAEILRFNRLIKNELVFIAYSRLTGYDTKLKAGDYVLNRSFSLPQIFEKLSKGQVQAVTFTIPEGFTVEQIAKALAQKGLVDEKKFLALAKKGAFNYPFIVQAKDVKYKLEGFLFPDTYKVRPGSSEEEIIEVMLQRFAAVYDEQARSKARELGLNDQELVTLASLIEKEAKVALDRPLISGVIYNRLNNGMRLQIDATIQYILGQAKPRLTYKDLEIESPYNTYLVEGLPPGPIASPGKAAIDAALNPAKTDYLYYVAKSDGSHVFSKTLEEHNKAKKKFLK